MYANEVTQIAISQRLRHMQPIQQGLLIYSRFPERCFRTLLVWGATILGQRISFHYDTRNNLVTPTDGMAVTAYAELNYNFKTASIRSIRDMGLM